MAGLFDTDGETDGQQELSRQEPRSRRDSRLHVDDLLRQDWNADAEPDDGLAHVVRQQHLRRRHNY